MQHIRLAKQKVNCGWMVYYLFLYSALLARNKGLIGRPNRGGGIKAMIQARSLRRHNERLVR